MHGYYPAACLCPSDVRLNSDRGQFIVPDHTQAYWALLVLRVSISERGSKQDMLLAIMAFLLKGRAEALMGRLHPYIWHAGSSDRRPLMTKLVSLTAAETLLNSGRLTPSLSKMTAARDWLRHHSVSPVSRACKERVRVLLGWPVSCCQRWKLHYRCT